MTKVTFKKHERTTGLAGIGYPYQSVDMKINKKVFGSIDAPNWQTTDNKWHVRVTVIKEPTKENPADFRWISFLSKHENEIEARNWIQRNIDGIIEKYDLYFQED